VGAIREELREVFRAQDAASERKDGLLAAASDGGVASAHAPTLPNSFSLICFSVCMYVCVCGVVTNAVKYLREEMEDSPSVQEAIRFSQAISLAEDFFFSPLTLHSFKRQALYTLRRRVRRQIKIRLFHLRCVDRRRDDLVHFSFQLLKSYVSYSKKCRLAVDWIRKGRQERWLQQWKALYARSQSQTLLSEKWTRVRLRSSIGIWRVGLKQRKKKRLQKDLLEKEVWRFRLRWIVLRWKSLVRPPQPHVDSHSRDNNNNGAASHTQIQLTEVQKEDMANKHFKHTILIAWINHSLQSQCATRDKFLVLRNLTHTRVKQVFFLGWIDACVSNRYWVSKTNARGMAKLRYDCRRKKNNRRSLRLGMDFFNFKSMLSAIRAWTRFISRRDVLRGKEMRVAKRARLTILVGTMSAWILALSAEREMRKKDGRAMAFYVLTMMRQSWLRWKRWHLTLRDAQRVRREILAQEVERERIGERLSGIGEGRHLATEQRAGTSVCSGDDQEPVGVELVSDDETADNWDADSGLWEDDSITRTPGESIGAAKGRRLTAGRWTRVKTASRISDRRDREINDRNPFRVYSMSSRPHEKVQKCKMKNFIHRCVRVCVPPLLSLLFFVKPNFV
jgi:hypothetical protein